MSVHHLKRKIGILTFHHSNHNFGAVLQAFSIYKLIEDLGHESYIIDFKPEKKGVKSHLFHFIQKKLGVSFSLFRHKYIPRIYKLTNSNADLAELNDKFDGFVVGSDQVWRYKEDMKALSAYYLAFVNDDKLKIAYGASFGVDTWGGNESETLYYKKLVNRFNYLSVREHSGANICKNVFGVNSTLVLDPTLLLDKSNFIQIAEEVNGKSKSQPEKYLAYMFLDYSKHTEDFFSHFASSNNLKFKNIKGTPIVPKKGFYHFNRVNKWLYLLKNAELVVTDSFHCIVFSIIFKKKFICLANKNRGTTRLQNLLALIGHQDRFFNDTHEIDKSKVFNEIDYSEVEKKLKPYQKKSFDFLKNALSDLE